MKKEVVFAIAFGLIVGLVITVGIYRARQAMEVPPDQEVPIAVQSTPDVTATPVTTSALLRVSEPKEDAVSDAREIQISGTTIPDSTIVVLHNEKEIIFASDSQGNFSSPALLEKGANVFTIRVLPDTGDPIELIRTVVYQGPIESPATSSGKLTSPKPTLKP